jgi:hypothetical protein
MEVARVKWAWSAGVLVVVTLALTAWFLSLRLDEDTSVPETRVRLGMLATLLDSLQGSEGRYPSEAEGVRALVNRAPQ